MKKNLLLLVLALIGMGGFTACNNEDDLLVQEQTNTKPVVIRASIGNVSRLALGEDDGTSTKVSWSTGDAFALKIGEQTYTFNWQEGNNFVYANDNGTFPETFATPGTITATYPASTVDLRRQSGKKDEVGKYMKMSASLDVAAEQTTDDLNLNFNHTTSVVEIALEKSELAEKSVFVELRTQEEEVMFTSMPSGDSMLSFDSEGKLTLYFAVTSSYAEFNDWHISVRSGSSDSYSYYAATLSPLQISTGKMYKVNKNSEALKLSSIVSNSSKKVVAYDAIGLYKWANLVSQSQDQYTNDVVDLELGANITLPTVGITLTDGLPDKGNWTPVTTKNSKPYQGSINGKNYIISNMYIVNTSNARNQGFLSNSIGEIKDLTFDNAMIVVGANQGIGVIAGVSRDNISNCKVTNSKIKIQNTSSSSYVGGLVGSLDSSESYTAAEITGKGKITDSSFNGTIEGDKIVGGIVGLLDNYSNTYITNCTVEGSITGNYKVGGIVGESRSFIEVCTNKAAVNGAASGGIVGVMDGWASTVGCTNEGEINGATSTDTYGTGGIVGVVEAEFSASVVTDFVIGCRNLNGNVTLTSAASKCGGIVGNLNRELSGVYGSYTVKSDVANAFTDCVAYNPNSATDDRNKVFESATDDDLATTGAGVMSLGIENAFNAMNSTSPSPYVSSGNYEIYSDYCWTFFAPGSWPEFKASVTP